MYVYTAVILHSRHPNKQGTLSRRVSTMHAYGPLLWSTVSNVNQGINIALLHHHLSSGVYRAIKLFLVGRMGRGKSTLLRRLCGLPDVKMGQSEAIAIDIGRFTYSPPRTRTRTSLFRNRQSQKEAVKFNVWDFAGRVYTVQYLQCIYMCVCIPSSMNNCWLAKQTYLVVTTGCMFVCDRHCLHVHVYTICYM